MQAVQIGKGNDLRVALEQANSITERLSFAFLLNSAVQRRGERVTAEEIRYVASELEDALGGMYSLLSQELQMPLVSRVMHLLEKQKALPVLPSNDVRPEIITGMEALGRGNDLGKLELALSKIAVLGPEEIVKRLNASDFIERVFTACGVSTEGLIRSEEEVQAAEQQAMMQQMMQQGMSRSRGQGTGTA